jgi:hypothetical protein
MARFKNNTGRDVYLDLGGLRRIAPDEIVDLVGTYSMPPLTLLDMQSKDFAPPKPKAKRQPKKPSPKGTSGTI